MKAGARGSPEINVHDVVHLEEGRRLLPAAKALHASHLPNRQWRETEAACRAVRAAGHLGGGTRRGIAFGYETVALWCELVHRY